MNNEAKAPFVRQYGSGGSPHMDMFLALLALTVLSVVNHGWRPAVLVTIGIVAAVLCEWLGAALMHMRPRLDDGSALYIGAAIGAMLSPLTPFYIPAVGAIFAILLVKLPFGGNGRYMFQPVAAAMAFLTVCFPEQVFCYDGVSVAASLRQGITPSAELRYLLSGDVLGAIGTTAAFLLVGCMLFLFLRRAASVYTVMPYLLTCAVLILFFPRTEADMWHDLLWQLCGGSLFFSGIFLLGDPVTAPKSRPGRIVFGILAGAATVLFAHLGQYEDNGVFALVLLTPLAPIIDRACWHLMRKKEGISK